MKLTSLLLLLLAAPALAAAPAKPATKLATKPEEKTLPYLGPGADKLSKEEYERIYKGYIQTTILLGYPFLRGPAPACDQALSGIFRQAGLFEYPVPGEATGIKFSQRKEKGRSFETFESGGNLVQLEKAPTGAPLRLIWINSGAPKATNRLAAIARREALTLEKDKVTGLEKVKGIPVGYPHMLLGKEGQGLTVRTLKFNGKKEGCEPEEFADNAWSGGAELGRERCENLQDDVGQVWREKLSTGDFYERELKRMKDLAQKEAERHGAKPEDAKRLVEKHFVPPFTAPVNVVGTAMRHLAQCNLLALGRASGVKKTPAAPGGGGEGSGGSSMDAKGAQ